MKTRNVRRRRRLTKEQEELRQGGLRLLARIIARHHLAHENGLRPSACETHLGDSENGPLPASGGESPVVEEDEHAR